MVHLLEGALWSRTWGKLKVYQLNVLVWLEELTEEVNEKILMRSQFSRYFATYVQDFCSGDLSELTEYFAKYAENGVYQ